MTNVKIGRENAGGMGVGKSRMVAKRRVAAGVKNAKAESRRVVGVMV